ncbi:hypothetical protein BTVI_80977 [Pitangus sulphuratus]|nr:hypothetical protein BTVI_80977 [Pitangus sulphuratus]
MLGAKRGGEEAKMDLALVKKLNVEKTNPEGLVNPKAEGFSLDGCQILVLFHVCSSKGIAKCYDLHPEPHQYLQDLNQAALQEGSDPSPTCEVSWGAAPVCLGEGVPPAHEAEAVLEEPQSKSEVLMFVSSSPLRPRLNPPEVQKPNVPQAAWEDELLPKVTNELDQNLYAGEI